MIRYRPLASDSEGSHPGTHCGGSNLGVGNGGAAGICKVAGEERIPKPLGRKPAGRGGQGLNSDAQDQPENLFPHWCLFLPRKKSTPRPNAYRQIATPARYMCLNFAPSYAERRWISPPLRMIPDLAAQYEATILDFRLAWLLFMPVADRPASRRLTVDYKQYLLHQRRDLYHRAYGGVKKKIITL